MAGSTKWTTERLLWATFQDDRRRRRRWRVWLVDRVEGDKGGMCNATRREIDICATLPYGRIIEKLGHEIVHSICAYPSRPPSEADLGGEELVAGMAEESLVPIMISLGAKIPKFPVGFRAFRARAIAREIALGLRKAS